MGGNGKYSRVLNIRWNAMQGMLRILDMMGISRRLCWEDRNAFGWKMEGWLGKGWKKRALKGK